MKPYTATGKMATSTSSLVCKFKIPDEFEPKKSMWTSKIKSEKDVQKEKKVINLLHCSKKTQQTETSFTKNDKKKKQHCVCRKGLKSGKGTYCGKPSCINTPAVI
jgi:hypothetical protein